MTMKPRQIELARHALGLKQGSRVSYRNYFAADEGHADYRDWMAMVAGDYAVHGTRAFGLTLKGARAALLPGEQLSPEDFPEHVIEGARVG